MALSFKLTKANYDALRSMSMTQRMQVAKNDEVGQWLLSLLSPTQLAELFPLYYQKMMPVDISGFTKAMPTSMSMAKQQAIEEQLQNTASGSSAGANMQAGGWRKKWQEGMSAKVGKATPQLTEEQQKIYDSLKSTPMSIDDPRAKMFAGLNENQLASVGVKRITQDGKDFFKYSAPTVTDDEVKRSIMRTGNFSAKAPAVMSRLQSELGLSKIEAAAVLGNLGHESMGLKNAIEEGHPNRYGTRGLGWAQWTNTPGDNRRERFEEWAATHGGVNSDEANLSFLIHELKTTHKSAIEALKKADGDYAKMQAFEGTFERAGIKNYDSRWRYMQQAISASNDPITQDYSDKNMQLAREKLIRNVEASRIGTLAEYTNAGLPAPGSPEATAIVGDSKGADAVAKKIKEQFGNMSNPQCVALAKAYVGSNSSVTEWRRGTNVMDGTLKPGTPIATFMDKNGNPSTMYDDGGTGRPKNNTTHAAVFLDYKRDGAGKIIGIRVMEQYKGSNGAHENVYPVGGFGTHNAANYHSINDKSGNPLGATNPMVQNAAVDPPKAPLNEFTSKTPTQAKPPEPPKPPEAKPENKDNTQPPKQVKPNAKGGVNKINTEQISAYPIGGAQGDNAVVVNAQQQPLFTMNTNERMLIDPKKDTAQVLPDQKPDVSQKPTQDTGVMDEFKAAIQELKNQFSQNDPGNFKQPDMPNKDTFDKDSAQGHILDSMNDLSKEWYSTPSMKRAAFRTGGVETGDPVSNFHYSHNNRS